MRLHRRGVRVIPGALAPGKGGGGRTLARRALLVLTAVCVALGIVLALLVPRLATRFAEERAGAMLGEVAATAALLVDRTLADQRAQMRLLGSSLPVIDAVRAGAADAERERLNDVPVATLEQRYDATRSLPAPDRLRRYFQRELESLGAAEVIITEANGFNVLATPRPSDFVQHDEAWWRAAHDTAVRSADVDFDESTGANVIVQAGPVVDRGSGRARVEGIIKIGFAAASLQAALQSLTPDGVAIEVVDHTGRVVLVGSRQAGTSGDSTKRDVAALDRLTSMRMAKLDWGGLRTFAAVRAGNGGAWRVVALTPQNLALASMRSTWIAIAAGAVLAVLLVLGAALMTHRFFDRRIARPVAELAHIAEAVAAGNLAVPFSPTAADDEIGRLSRAMSRMLEDLRQTTDAVKGAAAATTSSANQINLGTNGMATATVQIAQTASSLSSESVRMQQEIRSTAQDAVKLRDVAAELAAGARASTERYAQLRTQADANRQRFEDTEKAIGALSGDVETSAAAARAVDAAADQLAEFVGLVTKIAKQSKLLALNASLEAVRAGEEARGFATVAHEVRRLARSAHEGSERAEAVVEQVRGLLRDASGASTRAVERLGQVATAARVGRKSLEDAGASIAEADTWVQSVDRAAANTQRFVDDISTRLQDLAKRTEDYVAALQEVAASTQDQSAGAEQIATAANALLKWSADLATVIERFGGERKAA
ncbi:MAG: methyl-accepting chemotaxis protein [Gemmatimonadaceae bacterium]